MPTILPGRFNWHELLTHDPAAAHGFYESVVGWGTAPFGNEGYTMWMNGQTPVGGVLELPAEVKAMGIPPHWLTYISTPDVEATARRAEQMGGRILKPEEFCSDKIDTRQFSKLFGLRELPKTVRIQQLTPK